MNNVFDSTSRADMTRLADLVRKVPEPFHPALAAGIMAKGMMRTNWTLHAAVGFRLWRSKVDAFSVWLWAFKRFPVVASELVEATADWIVNGRDKTSRRSAGGLNSAEVEEMGRILFSIADGYREAMAA